MNLYGHREDHNSSHPYHSSNVFDISEWICKHPDQDKILTDAVSTDWHWFWYIFVDQFIVWNKVFFDKKIHINKYTTAFTKMKIMIFAITEKTL